MRPILLTLRGINSFETEQTIDFEKLTAAGLFGIFGPTGSGKTTVIDACTMALFSEMPRQSGRECVNCGGNEMYVNLEFELCGKRYVVERLYVREKNSLKQKRARLYEKTRLPINVISDRTREVDEAIENLIGLNYKDFSRSVVLPQGKFSEFLLLSERDRSNMLERIFGLEEYGDRFIKNLRKIKKETETQLALAENSISGLEGISQARVENEEAGLVKTRQKLTGLKVVLGKKQKKLESVKKLHEYVTELKTRKSKLSNLNARAKEIDQKRALLANAAKTRMIMPFIKSAEETEARIKEQRNIYELAAKKYREAESKYNLSQKTAEEASALKDSETPVLAGLEARITQAISINADCKRLTGERDALAAEYKAIIAQIASKASEREATITKREKAQTELDALSVKKIGLYISPERRREITNAYSLSQEEKKLTERVNALDARSAKILTAEKKDKREAEKISAELEKNEAERLIINETLDRLNSDRPIIHELRSGLREGEPCPVCGATSHPYKAGDGGDVIKTGKNVIGSVSISSAGNDLPVPEVFSYAEWEREREALKKTIAETDNKLGMLKTGLAAINARLEHSATLTEDIRAERGGILSERDSVNERLFNLTGGQDVDKLLSRITADDKESAKIQENENALRKLVMELATELEKQSSEIAALTSKKEAMTTTGVEKKERINEMKARIEDLIGDKAHGMRLDEYLTQVRKEMAELSKKAESAKEDLRVATDAAQILKSNADTESARLNALIKTLDDENEKITRLLMEHGIQSRETVKELWVESLDPETLEAEIAEYDSSIRDMNNGIERLVGLIKEQARVSDCDDLTELGTKFLYPARFWQDIKTYSAVPTPNEFAFSNLFEVGLRVGTDDISAIVESLENEHAALESGCMALEAEVLRESESAAVMNDRLIAMRAGLEKLLELQKQKSGHEHKLDLLTDLDKLFRGNEFVKYLSRRYLRQITLEASRRMKEMTAGRYAIELDGTEFVVRDDYNGGVRRSPRTLSGGETFMASLCLALALSVGIQLRNNAPLEFFFLDEGFGTLDHSMLDIVMDCLEKLKRDKMSIGVISHVDELKNRIPVKLIVSYDAVSGSRVEHMG